MNGKINAIKNQLKKEMPGRNVEYSNANGKNLKTWAVPSSWEIQAATVTVRFRPPVRPRITIMPINDFITSSE